ncbi:MAG: FAD-binding oxidoreductase [Acidimicrobiales bacterium]|nr:FAD-binding oxidoreductase [Acidimicrobiales bacterium]
MRKRVGVVGGGIAGASAAYHLLKADRSLEIILVEAEDQLGYHTTGRSAALLLENDGTESTRSIVQASVDFLLNPPEGLTENVFVRPRDVMHIATFEQSASVDRFLEENSNGRIPTKEISKSEAKKRFPALREEGLDRVVVDEGAGDIDVHCLHQAYLNYFRKNGGQIKPSTRIDSATRNGDHWNLETKMGEIPVDAIVNASGAWGDRVASRAGIEPVGLQPRRRTAFTVNSSEPNIQKWGMIADIDLQFYCKPDGQQLLCSLAEENPSEPCDAKHDEADVALAIERINAATTLDIRSVQTAWTGLRTFAPDRSMVIGPDTTDDSFFWCVGQGGTGIMTSPGVGRLLADLFTTGKPSEHFHKTGLKQEDIFPNRFRKK